MTKNKKMPANWRPPLVVPAKRRRKQKARKARRKSLITLRGKARVGVRNDDLRQYEIALSNPFAVEAIGVRVPDSYCFPTVTYHFRSTITPTTNASGLCGMCVLPSPCFSLIGGSGTFGGPTAFTANSGAYYFVAPLDMQTKLTEYRVVSWGIRLLAKDTALASKGKIWIALVPTTNNAPSWNTLNTVTASGTGVISEYTAGFDMGYLGSSIQNYPSVRVFSLQDLLRGEVQVTGVPLSNSFYDFKGTADRNDVPWNTGQVLADEGVFNNTAGLVNSTAGGRKDIASLRGGMAILIYGSGMPAATNEFDVEVIYHLEGSPNLSSTSGAVTGIVPSAQKVLHGSTSVMESVISAVRTAIPAVRMLKTAATADGATKGIVQAALGMAKLAL